MANISPEPLSNAELIAQVREEQQFAGQDGSPHALLLAERLEQAEKQLEAADYVADCAEIFANLNYGRAGDVLHEVLSAYRQARKEE